MFFDKLNICGGFKNNLQYTEIKKNNAIKQWRSKKILGMKITK